jgi:predicted nucleic acid-binding protein
MPKTVALDAWAVLAFLRKESPADLRVLEILEQAGHRQMRAVISIINLGEVYYRIGKLQGQKAADDTLADLRLLPMDILPADEEAVLAAARLKMKYPISYADAFAVAVSEAYKATLLTGDPELIALAGELHIERLHRED